MKKLIVMATAVFSLFACQTAPIATNTDDISSAQIVIAHRGASGYRPGHTIASYKLAIEMGADYIEPDLVMTKDGHLIARHDNELSLTTNIADHPEFADRKTTKSMYGMKLTGWFTEDFTLDELKTLKVIERRPDLRPNNAKYDNKLDILSLEDIIQLTRAESTRLKRPIGLYIELKTPDYFAKRGFDMESSFLKVLNKYHLNSTDADIPIYIQCFFPKTLMDLRDKTPLPLILLLSATPPPAKLLKANGIAKWEDVYSPQGLAKIAKYADGIGPDLRLVFPNKGRAQSSELVDDAHAAGLKVHVWTANIENDELPQAYRRGAPKAGNYLAQKGDLTGLTKDLLKAGVDGIFTDNPDIVVKVRKERQEASQ